MAVEASDFSFRNGRAYFRGQWIGTVGKAPGGRWTGQTPGGRWLSQGYHTRGDVARTLVELLTTGRRARLERYEGELTS